MQLWHSTRDDYGNLTDGRNGRGESSGNDSGCTDGEYFTVRHVYFIGQSSGSGGDSRSIRRPDTTALYADGSGNMDSHKTDRSRRREALSDERLQACMYKRCGKYQHYLSGTGKNSRKMTNKFERRKEHGRVFITRRICGRI